MWEHRFSFHSGKGWSLRFHVWASLPFWAAVSALVLASMPQYCWVSWRGYLRPRPLLWPSFFLKYHVSPNVFSAAPCASPVLRFILGRVVPPAWWPLVKATANMFGLLGRLSQSFYQVRCARTLYGIDFQALAPIMALVSVCYQFRSDRRGRVFRRAQGSKSMIWIVGLF